MASASTSAADDWKFPLLLSFLAGASTCAGAAIVFMFDAKQIEKSMTFSLSLAASVMITVSVISIGPECLEDVITYSSLNHQVTMDLPLLGERLLSFGAGCFSYWLLSKALAAFPEPESLFFLQPQTNVKGVAEEADEERANLMISRSHSSDTYSPNKHTTSSPNKPSKASISQRNTPGVRRTNSRIRDELTDSDDDSQIHVLYEPKESKEDASSKRRSWRVAMLLFFSLMFHNFPEGLAVAASAVESRQLGVTVAIGIMIHNIPEGIAIAVPCIAARPDSPWLAFWLASSSGLAEPLGAVFALFILRAGNLPLENVLACVAGIMCTVAFVELYPEAMRHVPSTDASKDYGSLIYGTLVGMAIMMATEWYLP